MFNKKKTLKLPDGFIAEDIKIESSICSGEKTIGFYDRKNGRLINAEFVRNSEDIAAFYAKYNLDYKE